MNRKKGKSIEEKWGSGSNRKKGIQITEAPEPAIEGTPVSLPGFRKIFELPDSFLSIVII